MGTPSKTACPYLNLRSGIMLTPKQIKNVDFATSGRNAYRMDDVDDFMSEVYESYDQMFRENAELVKKLNLLADKVAEYKADEDKIHNALLMAERMKESVISEAQEKAREALSAAEEKVRTVKTQLDEKTKELMDAAQKESERIVSEAKAQASETMAQANSNATTLLAKAQEIYAEQVDTIKAEADKEMTYLNKIKAESQKVRSQLMDTYERQIHILEYTPDFSEELKDFDENEALNSPDVKKALEAAKSENQEIVEDSPEEASEEALEEELEENIEEIEEADEFEEAEEIEDIEDIEEEIEEEIEEIDEIDEEVDDDITMDEIEEMRITEAAEEYVDLSEDEIADDEEAQDADILMDKVSKYADSEDMESSEDESDESEENEEITFFK